MERPSAQAAGWYRERLAGLPLSFQARAEEETHVYHLFQVRTRERMRFSPTCERATSTWSSAIRPPIPCSLPRRKGGTGAVSVAEQLARELLCLPIRPDIGIDEIDYVADCVREFFGKTARG